MSFIGVPLQYVPKRDSPVGSIQRGGGSGVGEGGEGQKKKGGGGSATYCSKVSERNIKHSQTDDNRGTEEGSMATGRHAMPFFIFWAGVIVEALF